MKLPRPAGYLHTMDNTEGIKGNTPLTTFSSSARNPFGVPGHDYSESYPVTAERLYTEKQVLRLLKKAQNA